MDWVMTGIDAPGIKPRPGTVDCSTGPVAGAPRTDTGGSATAEAPNPEVKL